MKPFAVDVENAATSEALQRAAFAAGWKWLAGQTSVLYVAEDGAFPNFHNTRRIGFEPSRRILVRCPIQYELVSIPEAFRRLREQITPPKPKTKTVAEVLGCVDGTTVEEREAATLAALRAIAEAHNYLCDKQCFPTCKVDIETVTIPAGEGE